MVRDGGKVLLFLPLLTLTADFSNLKRSRILERFHDERFSCGLFIFADAVTKLRTRRYYDGQHVRL